MFRVEVRSETGSLTVWLGGSGLSAIRNAREGRRRGRRGSSAGSGRSQARSCGAQARPPGPRSGRVWSGIGSPPVHGRIRRGPWSSPARHDLPAGLGDFQSQPADFSAGPIPASAGPIPVSASPLPSSAGPLPISAGPIPSSAGPLLLSAGRLPLSAEGGRLPAARTRLPVLGADPRPGCDESARAAHIWRSPPRSGSTSTHLAVPSPATARPRSLAVSAIRGSSARGRHRRPGARAADLSA